MIVWTFQDKDCVKSIMNGVWYKDHSRYGNARLKDVDKKYVSSVTMPDGEKVLATPIYTFGKMVIAMYLCLEFV